MTLLPLSQKRLSLANNQNVRSTSTCLASGGVGCEPGSVCPSLRGTADGRRRVGCSWPPPVPVSAGGRPRTRALQTETACLILVSQEPHLLCWPVVNISDDCRGRLSRQDLGGQKLGETTHGRREERAVTDPSSRGREGPAAAAVHNGTISRWQNPRPSYQPLRTAGRAVVFKNRSPPASHLTTHSKCFRIRGKGSAGSQRHSVPSLRLLDRVPVTAVSIGW